MTLKEAFKAGLPIKRKAWENFVHNRHLSLTMDLKFEDAIAEDWEVKEEPRRWRMPIAALDGWTEQAAMDLMNGDDHFDYVEVVEVEK